MSQPTIKLSEAIAALERGEEVEWSFVNSSVWYLLTWEKLEEGVLRNANFRLKQKPMEIWVNFYADKNPYIFFSKVDAVTNSDYQKELMRQVAVHFREVIE